MGGEISAILTTIRMVLRRKSGMSGAAPLCRFLLILRLAGRAVAPQRDVHILQYPISCLPQPSPEPPVGSGVPCLLWSAPFHGSKCPSFSYKTCSGSIRVSLSSICVFLFRFLFGFKRPNCACSYALHECERGQRITDSAVVPSRGDTTGSHASSRSSPRHTSRTCASSSVTRAWSASGRSVALRHPGCSYRTRCCRSRLPGGLPAPA